MSSPVISIPGVGNVEFPASMSQDQVNQAAHKLFTDAASKQISANPPGVSPPTGPEEPDKPPSAEQEKASRTRQNAVAGLTGLPTPTMDETDRDRFAAGKVVGAVSNVATVGALAGGELTPAAAKALQAAAKSHPFVAALLKKALEGTAFAAGVKYLHLLGKE